MATLDEALALALDLHTAGRLEEAEELYVRILDAVPEEPNALHLHGLLCAQGQRLDEAVALIGKAVAVRPDVAEYRANLAKLHQARGDLSAAADEYCAALALCPDSAALSFPLAQLDRRCGRNERALAAYRRTLVIQPDHGEATAQVGILGRRTGRGAQAVAALRHAVRLRPDLGEAWHHLGVALQQAKDLDALDALCRAAGLLPQDANVHVNLAHALSDAGGEDAAERALRRALALDPASAEALSGLAKGARGRREIDTALALHDRALHARPESTDARWSRSLTRLLAGRLPEGWEDYEARWSAPGFPTKPRGFSQPLWQGEDIAGRTILLHEEQGRGDAIQFVRYAPMVACRGARVLLEAGADLVPLLQSLPGVERVFARGEALPAFDLHCPLLSLPRAFGTTLDSIPAEVPYLSVEPERAAAWRERLAGPELKIGLVWAGNPNFAGDRERSPGLEPLLPVLEVAGCRVFGLQFGPGRDALAGRVLPASFIDLGQDIVDFRDNAAAILALDVVVTSCTVTAHLAGALGVPVWVLLSYVPDWRWLLDRDDSPWYPTARLFRQKHPGDWAAVARDVTAALAERVAATSASGR
ncbi:tetratricopeptide repeat protein [Azospirillum sp. sgz302134]